MDFTTALPRFRFLAQALEGSGGFLPRVRFETSADGLQKPASVAGACHLVPYPRESAAKYAARVACMAYENHLRSACERFVGYLGRKSPAREGVDNPLAQVFLQDADDAGHTLDAVLQHAALHAKARGSMLLLLDMPAVRQDASAAQTLAQRAVPYIAPLYPEDMAEHALDDRGRFLSIGIHSTALIGGERKAVLRRWDAQGWSVWQGERMIEAGPHPFGACPVVPITENGAPFPQVGKFAQIADLSVRLMNAQSELTELLRSQTFSVLTIHVPPDVPDPVAAANQATSTIGTHSALVHQGNTPAFIAPDSAPGQLYLQSIDALQAAIHRIGLTSATESGGQAESGLARRMRFEALNAELASFARVMQEAEERVWALFHTALGTANRVQVQWPSDYNLTDAAAELDILAMMQATGFSEAVQTQKRRTIVLAEFDRTDEDTLSALLASLDQALQAASLPGTGTATAPE